LLLTLSANAQQSANASSPEAIAQAPESDAQPGLASSHEQHGPQPPNAARQPLAPSVSIVSASVAPATMHQVVDRVIEREHALMEMLKTRTPLVET
jgi:hypothetical protein